MGVACAEQDTLHIGSDLGSFEHLGRDRIHPIRELDHVTGTGQHIERQALDRAPVVEEVMGRVYMRAEMDTGTHSCHVDMRTLVHGLRLFELKPRVAGPGGKSGRDRQGNIVDGHERIPL